MSFLKFEMMEKADQELIEEDWSQSIPIVPQQANVTDCGFYAMKNLDFMSRGLRPDYTPQDIPYFKKAMIYEISTCQLIT